MRKDIEAGKFEGWDDPRLPTISAKEKRITADALRNFWIELGITQKDISVPLATLYSIILRKLMILHLESLLLEILKKFS